MTTSFPTPTDIVSSSDGILLYFPEKNRDFNVDKKFVFKFGGFNSNFRFQYNRKIKGRKGAVRSCFAKQVLLKI